MTAIAPGLVALSVGLMLAVGGLVAIHANERTSSDYLAGQLACMFGAVTVLVGVGAIIEGVAA